LYRQGKGGCCVATCSWHKRHLLCRVA
jgi:hypothetical protein